MSEARDRPVDGECQRKAPLIIGVGASAGAPDSIERFFAKLTVGADQAIVLALQHHEAFDEPRLRRLVQGSNGGKVAEIADGHAIEGGKIYLCPLAMITTIQGDRFPIRKAEQAPGERAAFLRRVQRRMQVAQIDDIPSYVDFPRNDKDEVQHLFNAREGEQMRVSGPKVRLQPKAAETFALAIHELATNALKYGALSQPTGRIEITWRLDEGTEPAELVFEWRERGGPRVTPPPRKGFGAELLERTLAFEFKGQTTIAFNPAGLQCTITLPVSKRTFHTPGG